MLWKFNHDTILHILWKGIGWSSIFQQIFICSVIHHYSESDFWVQPHMYSYDTSRVLYVILKHRNDESRWLLFCEALVFLLFASKFCHCQKLLCVYFDGMGNQKGIRTQQLLRKLKSGSKGRLVQQSFSFMVQCQLLGLCILIASSRIIKTWPDFEIEGWWSRGK